MKRIVLLCAAGMSTSLLVTKMQEAAAKEGYECEIEAHSVIEASRWIPQADVVMIGPQVRYELERLRRENPDVPIEPMDMMLYGMVDGAGLLKQARELAGE